MNTTEDVKYHTAKELETELERVKKDHGLAARLLSEQASVVMSIMFEQSLKRSLRTDIYRKGLENMMQIQMIDFIQKALDKAETCSKEDPTKTFEQHLKDILFVNMLETSKEALTTSKQYDNLVQHAKDEFFKGKENVQ